MAIDLKDVPATLRQYLALKAETELLTKRQNELKARLSDAIDEYGDTDHRGHISLEITREDGEVQGIMRQKRVSQSLDIEVAEEVLTRKGLRDKCIKMVPTLDEEAIMASFYHKYLTEEDIDSMFPKKESYAFIVGKV